MAPIAGAASTIQAYQREASRLASAVPRVPGKAVTRNTSVSLGPFSVQYTATDYEFDLTGSGVSSSFTDALDAAMQAQSLGQDATSDAKPNAVTTRQALASYQAVQALSTVNVPRSMFSATV